MTEGTIEIRRASQNNLAGVDVSIPRERLIAITGVSGSGKSSLAFDTLFREGQRRFLETLSAYARQFLGQMQKPDVESIEGLSPAIAVDQKSLARGARSTVGTLTEIADHLRVLWARAGRPHCPECDLPVESRTPEEIVQAVLRDATGKAVHVLSPRIRDRKGHHKPVFEDLRKKGFVRARVDGEIIRLEEAPELSRYKRHSIEVVVDRLKPDAESLPRLREAVAQALELGDGDLMLDIKGEDDRRYSTLRTCPGCGGDVPLLEPRLFSFNSPHGACPTCEGLGVLRRPSEAALIADPTKSIRDGALAVTRASGGGINFPRASFSFLETVAEANHFDLNTPWEELDAKSKRVIMRGTGQKRYVDTGNWNGAIFKGSVRWKRKFLGVLPSLEKDKDKGLRGKQAKRFLTEQVCPDCDGHRLRAASRAVRLGGRRYPEFTHAPIEDLTELLDSLELTKREARIARDLLAEVRRRTTFLLDVGLGYLTLDRAADSLSGGEAQRIRLAAQLGAGLQGVLYVLDEPSIGLHARDNNRLLGALRRLCDSGNTVVVVEHDQDTLRAADWVIDVGPGAGKHGGHIVASGTPADVAKADGETAALLRGELHLTAPDERRPGSGKSITVHGARAFNLKDIDVSFPLGKLIAVTGVSGSGKSTLVERILARAMTRHLGREAPLPEEHDKISGLDEVDELVVIDATPIGRTPRSNPATYVKVFGTIRELFAALPESKMRGYTKSRFSFNVEGGRCETCGGAGALYVELQFLAPVTVPCSECGGKRFQAETLEARYREHSIADVLALTVEDALEFFKDHPKIARPLSIMVDVGLGYLALGQPSTTLSGGEAQRLKLVTQLQKRPKKHTVYLLDEPTTGLHLSDVAKLSKSLQGLVDLGHTVIVIEHDLDLVRAADWVIDLGPEGGAGGGELIAEGTPEELEECGVKSATGMALAEAAENSRSRKGLLKPKARKRTVKPPTHVKVVGARTHNLRNIDVDLPRGQMSVITGPSGSGKSSLALDTIYTEGRRRFVESLSTYARQFLGTKDRPPVERIEGLGPSVAVEARTASGHPRSTVATTTEIHDHLRVLWARAGEARCPEHGVKLERSDAGRVARTVVKDFSGEKGWVLAPFFGPHVEEPDDPDAELARRIESWRAGGFARMLVNGEEVRLEEKPKKLPKGAIVDLVIDRLSFGASTRSRLAEAVEQSDTLTGGRVSVLSREHDGDGNPKRREFSTRGACPQCGFHLEAPLEPRHFSFNTHVGACLDCDGLGFAVRCDPELLVQHTEKSLLDGAIGGRMSTYLTKGKGFYEMLLREVASKHKVDLEKPVRKLTAKERGLIFNGKGARKKYSVEMHKTTRHAEVEESFESDWAGLCGHVDAWHKKAEDPDWAAMLEERMTKRICPACDGERLRPEYSAVTLGKKRLPELLRLSVEDALAFATALTGRKRVVAAVGPVLEEVTGRLALLDRVGLGYLTLDRSTSTLSGGEARRVRLSASLGSHLVDVCYVLDEPTVGLHPGDVSKLTDALLELRDRGNTVLVVEHDQTVMERADWLVDMGPGSGRKGGQVVAAGTPAAVKKNKASLTGRWLRGELQLERTSERNSVEGKVFGLRGAKLHNLKKADFQARFGELTGVCGPSGSGKSTLILECLVPALKDKSAAGRWSKIEGFTPGATRVVVVDDDPIGRSPMSCPATYTGVMDAIRALFERTPEARMRGYQLSHFSFNSTKGRCPACDGRGAQKVEMQFLADLWLTCEECEGRRFAPHILEVMHRGRSIADVLEMSAEEALEFFEHQPAIRAVLKTMCDVGLGYLALGQSSTTLSGGEAQRVKLVSELLRAEGGPRSILILDEPTTGLHASDVAHLLAVLDRLAARGHAVIVIEHHTGLLAHCDRLVELGPAGGAAGGTVIAQGTPKELVEMPESVTGPWIAPEFNQGRSAKPAASKAARRKKTTSTRAKKAPTKKRSVRNKTRAARPGADS